MLSVSKRGGDPGAKWTINNAERKSFPTSIDELIKRGRDDAVIAMHPPCSLPAAAMSPHPAFLPTPALSARPARCTRGASPLRPSVAMVASPAQRLYERAREDTARVARGVAVAAAVAAIGTGIAAPALAEVPNAAPSGFFYDEPMLVQKSSSGLFGKALQSIKNRTGYSVRFVMVKSFPYGESPNDYAEELFGQWALGGNDILFVASPKLARAGVSVGDNAKALITPEISESLCNETYALKAGDELYSSAVLEVSNRLIPLLAGEKDPGPPDMTTREVSQTYKTKAETSNQRQKYITVVAAILIISVVAPLLQTYWYVRDD